MNAAVMTLGRALEQGLLLSNVEQSYYNAFSLGRWPWLSKKHNKLWVDLAGFKHWCIDTARPIDTRRLAKLDAVIQQMTMEEANT